MFTNHSLVFLDEYCWNSMGRFEGGGKGGVESGGVGRRRWMEKEPNYEESRIKKEGGEVGEVGVVEGDGGGGVVEGEGREEGSA